MMRAYSKNYVEDAADCIGEAFDYVSNACQLDIGMFLGMFTTGSFAARVEEADPSVVLGMSGSELACRVLMEAGIETEFPDGVNYLGGDSEEFAAGYYLAKFQWYSGRSFRNILQNISLEEFTSMLPAMISEDDGWREEAFNGIIEKFGEKDRLQEARKRCGYSQRQLAEAAGINIRTLQQYEIKSKDINRAAAETVENIAKCLGCTAEDILEY